VTGPAGADGLPAAPLHERLGIEVAEAAPGRTTGRLPVEGNTQPFGLLHGGATAALVEGLASYAATLHGLPDKVAVGMDLHVTHHRAVRTGWVHGVATPLHLGRSVATYEVVVSDEDGRRVATGRLSCLLRPAAQTGPTSD
jgi:1,4-dihydroxy-2-naphthoyl-CoA hydrolase